MDAVVGALALTRTSTRNVLRARRARRALALSATENRISPAAAAVTTLRPTRIRRLPESPSVARRLSRTISMRVPGRLTLSEPLTR